MFTLIWMNEALDELADVYVAADPAQRATMASAVDALNARLRSDPLDEGESRAGGTRITFVSLLAIGFPVSQADRVVRVTGVARYGR